MFHSLLFSFQAFNGVESNNSSMELGIGWYVVTEFKI